MKERKLFDPDFVKETQLAQIKGGENGSSKSELIIYLFDCPTWGDCKKICNYW